MIKHNIPTAIARCRAGISFITGSLCILMSCLIPLQSHGYPVVSSAEIISGAHGTNSWYVNITWMDVPGLGDHIYKPLHQYGCGVGHKHWGVDELVPKFQVHGNSRADWLDGTSLEECAKTLVLPSTEAHYGGTNFGYEECIAVLGYDKAGDLLPLFATTVGPNVCIKPPPTNASCTILTPSITLDHGAISVGVTSDRKSAKFGIDCNMPVKIAIKLTPEILELAAGVTSNLTSSAPEPVSVPEGHSELEIYSELTVQSSATLGAHSKSAVAILEYF